MKLVRLVTIAALLLSTPTALGGGFLLYEHGAKATGMADARTALADDVNALYFNPAAIAELDGIHLELGLTGIIPKVSYTAAGQSDRTYTRFGEEEPVYINDGLNDTNAKIRAYTPIHVYASYKIPDTGLSVGLGVNNPFGMGSFWPGDFDGRFIGTETEIQTFFTQPVVAADVAQLLGFKEDFKLSVAVGYNLVYATALLAKHIDLRFAETYPLAGDIRNAWGVMKMNGDAIGHGWNVALYAELPDLLSVGFSLRSGVSLPFSGTARFSFNEAGQTVLQTLGMYLPEKTTGNVTIDLPMNLNVGVAFLGIERLKIAFDFYAAFFSTFDELSLEFSCLDDDPPCSAASDPIPKHWHISAQMGLGAEYEVIDGLKLRAGYGMVFGIKDGKFKDSAIPAETYDPSLPDGRRDLICFGAGFGMDWWQIDFGYMLAIWEGTKDNDIGGFDVLQNPNGKANGKYESMVSLIALSLAANF